MILPSSQFSCIYTCSILLSLWYFGAESTSSYYLCSCTPKWEQFFLDCPGNVCLLLVFLNYHHDCILTFNLDWTFRAESRDIEWLWILKKWFICLFLLSLSHTLSYFFFHVTQTQGFINFVSVRRVLFCWNFASFFFSVFICLSIFLFFSPSLFSSLSLPFFVYFSLYFLWEGSASGQASFCFWIGLFKEYLSIEFLESRVPLPRLNFCADFTFSPLSPCWTQKVLLGERVDVRWIDLIWIVSMLYPSVLVLPTLRLSITWRTW